MNWGKSPHTKQTFSQNSHETPRGKTQQMTLKKTTGSEKSMRYTHLVKWLALLVTIMSMLWALVFLSPLFKPKEIMVSGTEQVSDKDILYYSGISKQQNMFGVLLDASKTNEAITTALPKVQSVQVKHKGIRTVVLIVQENPAVGYFQTDSVTYELLADRQIIEVSGYQERPNYPKLLSFDDQKDVLYKLSDGFKEVPSNIIKLIDTITYSPTTENPNRIELKMKDGLTVRADLTTVGKRMIYYPKARESIKKNSGVLDMQVGIYYSPTGE